jgi:hypothetical protein
MILKLKLRQFDTTEEIQAESQRVLDTLTEKNFQEAFQKWRLTVRTVSTPGMANMRPFARTPAARTKDTVIWSFNGQNCSFYNLNWINVRRSQKNGTFFFIQNVFYTWKFDRLFPSVKNILNKENKLYVRHVKHAARGRMSCVAITTTQM